MINYGGTLSVTNLSGTLAAGDRFKIFSASNSTGDFETVAGSPGLKLGWKFYQSTGELLVSSITPTNLAMTFTNGMLKFFWPTNYLGWSLQVQTNSMSDGLGTNWILLPFTAMTNEFTAAISPTNGSVFYRLVFP